MIPTTPPPTHTHSPPLEARRARNPRPLRPAAAAASRCSDGWRIRACGAATPNRMADGHTARPGPAGSWRQQWRARRRGARMREKTGRRRATPGRPRPSPARFNPARPVPQARVEAMHYLTYAPGAPRRARDVGSMARAEPAAAGAGAEVARALPAGEREAAREALMEAMDRCVCVCVCAG